MSFCWNDFLQLAKELSQSPAQLGPREAVLRSAASRAYYAAYHCALALANREGYDDDARDTGTHAALRKHFRTQPKERELHLKIADRLEKCCRLRIKADYKDDLGRMPESAAEWAIVNADDVIEFLDRLENTD